MARAKKSGTGRPFGWHSGSMTCKDAYILGDLYIQDDLVFGDVSAGALAVTGGIDLSSTTTNIGINLNGATVTKDIVLKNGESINNSTNGYVDTDGALRISGTGGAGAANSITLQYSSTSAGTETATMSNAPVAGDPAVWLDVYYGETKYVVPLFASA